MHETSEQEKAIAALLKERQESLTADDPPLLCPRCGQKKLNLKMVKNALSRHEDIYICSSCGTEEALADCCHLPPFPLHSWAGIVAEMISQKSRAKTPGKVVGDEWR